MTKLETLIGEWTPTIKKISELHTNTELIKKDVGDTKDEVSEIKKSVNGFSETYATKEYVDTKVKPIKNFLMGLLVTSATILLGYIWKFILGGGLNIS